MSTTLVTTTLSERSATLTAAAGVRSLAQLFTGTDNQLLIDSAARLMVTNFGPGKIVFTTGSLWPRGANSGTRIVNGQLIEDMQADTPVSTSGSEHGSLVNSGDQIQIDGPLDINRLRLKAAADTRISITFFK